MELEILEVLKTIKWLLFCLIVMNFTISMNLSSILKRLNDIKKTLKK